jgi:photosystem II stability/assembly factor-like uncharacterized protein
MVYVAALGHAFGPNSERGVFRSSDGGASWAKLLFTSEKAGAVDLTMDANPRILYAAVWEAYRSFWQISSGGPDSGLWMSRDGGDTWSNISGNPGLPKGTLGKIGVAASPARPGRVWALVEHQPEGGLYRSDDYGATWERVCADQRLISRAWYYMHITADPLDADTVYINNLSFWKSSDGGKTFAELPTPHGDNHDLWIDSRNPQRMIQGNDGGANVSLNGGATWSSIYNQPTAQFYHITADTRSPYVVYGTQQDNSSIAVPSRTHRPAILWRDCYEAGTGESGHIAVRPDDPDIVYIGAIGSAPGGGNCLQRYDHRTRQIRMITTWPEYMGGYGAEDDTYRFHWTYPIVISPHDPNTLYVAGNIVFRSTDEGQSWTPISPDLTRADPETLKPTGGPINRDSIGAETYATVFALAESPHQPGLLWAGSDDGLLHLSRDGGKSWQNITPPDFPEWLQISCIELSPVDAGTAYLAGTRYKLDDYRPYLYKTSDYGKSWQAISNGIAADAFTRVIRCDPKRPGLLYAGTETGLYLSFDDGANWQPFQLNLPVAPLYDLIIKDNDLIAGTHGRSIWILDDLTPLHQLADTTSGTNFLFAPRATTRIAPTIDWTGGEPGRNYLATSGGIFVSSKTPEGATVRRFLDAGHNPPKGAVITYHLASAPEEPISLSFADKAGTLIRSFSSVAPEGKKDELRISAKAGWNRFVWDLRHPPTTKLDGGDEAWETVLPGPMVPPGDYTVTLTVGEWSVTQPLTLVKEARVPATQAELQAQFELAMQLHGQVNRVALGINRMRDLRRQLEGWRKRAAVLPTGAAIVEQATALQEKVLEIEKRLRRPDMRPGWADGLNQGVGLLQQLMELAPVVEIGDYQPTEAMHAVFAKLRAATEAQLTAFERLVDSELPTLNTLIADGGAGAVMV